MLHSPASPPLAQRPSTGHAARCFGASVAEVVRLLPRVFSGGHVRHPKVAIYRAARIRIDGPPEVQAQADGELIGGLPLDIAVVPGALRVLTAG